MSTVHKALKVTGHGVATALSRRRVLSPMSLPATEKTPVAKLAVRDGRQLIQSAELLWWVFLEVSGQIL